MTILTDKQLSHLYSNIIIISINILISLFKIKATVSGSQANNMHAINSVYHTSAYVRIHSTILG